MDGAWRDFELLRSPGQELGCSGRECKSWRRAEMVGIGIYFENGANTIPQPMGSGASEKEKDQW